jgi:hypothetical protein
MEIKLQEKYGAKHYFQDPQPPTRKQPTQIHKSSPPLRDKVPPKSPDFHNPNASMAESQFERLQQQISILEETNSQMADSSTNVMPSVKTIPIRPFHSHCHRSKPQTYPLKRKPNPP